MSIMNKAMSYVRTHKSQTRTGLEQGGELLDRRTGGKYARQIDAGQKFLNSRLGLGTTRPGRRAPKGRDQANP
jgi:hypothetical protein